MEFTTKEKELMQKLLYNEALKQKYLLKIEVIKELPEELVGLLDKFGEGGE